MRSLLAIAITLSVLGILAGCVSAPKPEPVYETRTVSVAVPIACREPEPAAPPLPTNDLPPKPGLDKFVAAAVAEIDLLRAYSSQLLTALRVCTAPVSGAK